MLIGLTEFYRALSQKFLPIHTLGYLLSIGYVFILNNFVFSKFLVMFSAFIIALLIFLVFESLKTNIIDCVITFFGFFYITFLLSFIFLVRKQTYGNFFVWLIFISGWGCDTFAYFIGKIFGRNKLVPNLSPKKTIEGALGGIIGSVVVSYFYSFFFANAFGINYSKINFLCVIICFVGAIFSELGDLSASAIKRYKHLKDYGNILPGHGGFLDRFDSILFTAPIIYIALYLIRNIGR
jgi:phosphatidate cytidylyltransferase